MGNNIFNKDKLQLFNYFHNGDIHWTRAFVRELSVDFDITYFHKNNKEILKDLLDRISQENLSAVNYDPGQELIICDDITVLNSWIGCSGGKYLGIKNGVSFSGIYNLFSNHYKYIGIQIRDIDFYIPSIQFAISPQCNPDFINKIGILICNNNTLSGQSENFDFFPICKELSKEFANRDVKFYFTNFDSKINELPNFFFIGNIFPGKISNLIEISKFTENYCNIIIGRSSGPYTFCVTKENILNCNKKFIGICHNRIEAFGCEELFKSKCIHTNNYDKNYLSKFLCREIHEFI